MRVAIVGSGMIGGTAARLLTAAGRQVAIANSRGPDSLGPLVGELGDRARAATVDEAVRWGDVVLLALPWRRRDELPAADAFAGKIVVDATNAYGEGGVVDVEPSTSSEEVRKLMPEARLVKAFNTLYFKLLGERAHEQPPLALLVAGDDDEAKATVMRLIEEIGFEPVDTGSLAEGGRKQQPGSPVYNVPLTGDEARTALASL